MRHIILGCLLIGAIFSLSACFSGEQDVQTYVADIKKNSVGKVKELPPIIDYQGESYTAGSLRNPFDNSRSSATNETDETSGVAIEGIKQAPRPDANRKREYLEGFDLDDFVMVGTLSKKNLVWGIIKDKQGMVFTVKVGDYIGENSGQVSDIAEEKISIIETVENGKGGWMQRTTLLPLDMEQ